MNKNKGKGKGKPFFYMIGQLSRGGQERQLCYLLRELSHIRGYHTVVIIWNYDEDEPFVEVLKSAGVKIVGFTTESTLKKLLYSRKLVQTEQACLLHSYSYYLNFLSWLICLGTGCTPIGSLRSLFKRVFHYRGKLTMLLNSIVPYHFISNNYEGAHELDQFYRMPLKKIYVVSNKMPMPEINKPPVSGRRMIETISIGSLRPIKRPDWIIDVIGEVIKQGYHVHHIHLGDGELFDALQNQIRSRNLQAHIELKGTVNDVGTYLNNASILIHTSKVEGCPNVLMEAMAYGCAVVSTACGDAPRIVRHGETGFIARVNDMPELISHLKKLLNSENLRMEMGVKGRKIAEEQFDINYLTEDILKVYGMIRPDCLSVESHQSREAFR